MGVLAPDAGVVRLAGRPVTALDRRRFGYMPEERGLYPKQKVLGQLAYLGSLRGMPPASARRAALEYQEPSATARPTPCSPADPRDGG